MPTYKYRREDGTTFTIRQKITDDALDECPDTGQPVERVITGGMGFHLKGGGWYEDGYASPGASEESNGASEEEGPSDETQSESASEEKGAEASSSNESSEEQAA
ncbi:MAG: FmdB family transcriptional regulator [Bacteroidetes bacterium QH_2_67_10]|jgi:putative FmdB family regulatory protein|nr:MAG: FmdB family transcriptional regulator [Bacteroidetes bacterium QH_2_67_10]